MAKAESKYIHPLGLKIRKYRKLRGMTQKELGNLCGVNESTIRNYELGNRYPDDTTLRNIADALRVDQYALADPDPSSVFGAMQILFDLEERFGISPELRDGEIILRQRPLPETSPEPTQSVALLEEEAAPTAEDKLHRLQFREALELWAHIRKVCDEGNLLDEEYADWKSRYPDYIDETEAYGFTPNPDTEQRILELSKEIPADHAPESHAKRPRKSRLSS